MRGDRERVATAEWDGGTPAGGMIALVAGDVADPLLGLSPAAYGRLAGRIDGIVHCAALVRFDAPRAELDRVNVAGTANALALARARPGRPAAFVHVSTAYACGERNGPVAEDAAVAAPRFANGYEASKHAAEKVVRAARAEGVAAAIARPGIVLGRSSDGAIAAFDGIYGAFRLLAEGRIGTLPAHANASLAFVPVDHVVNGIATMVRRIDEAAGHAFHLVPEAPLPVARFFDTIGAYPQFVRPALVAPERFDPATLSPAERRLHRRVALAYGSYFRRNPLFDDRNVRTLLGLGSPSFGADRLRRQIDYAVARGFLRAAPGGSAKAPAPPGCPDPLQSRGLSTGMESGDG